MSDNLLELARAVVVSGGSGILDNQDRCLFCFSDEPWEEHDDDCDWLLLKQEVERIDASKTTYKRTGEGLKFAEPCKPQPYQIGESHGG